MNKALASKIRRALLCLFLLLPAGSAVSTGVPFPVTNSVDASFDFANSVVAADVDGDGDMDALGAAVIADDITWWENAGSSGTNWIEHPIAGAFNGACDAVAADLNGDGYLDALGSGSEADDITWWQNVGGPGTNWIERTIDGSFDGARGIYSADVDGDGDPDVIGGAFNDDDITWWENASGAGTNWVEHPVDTNFDGAHAVFSADVDGDGDADILGAAETAGDIAWWENTAGTGVNWLKHDIDTAFLEANGVTASDIDGDGDADVIGAAHLDDDVVWWENNGGAGTNWIERFIDPSLDGARWVHAADLDRDGDQDVLAAKDISAGADIVWYENLDGLGTTLFKRIVDSNFSGARSVVAADIDEDGDPDVLGAAALSGGRITWWANKTIHRSALYCQKTSVDSSFTFPLSAQAGDLDGDGDADLLGAAAGADEIAWWENTDGTGTNLIQQVIDADFDFAVSVYPADVDGDGDNDVVGAALLADEFTWWENTAGDGSAWIKQTVDGNVDGATAVFPVDLDGDGDVDLTGAAFNDDDIAWWRNVNGSGTNWVKILIDGNFNGARSVYSADVNGDGRPDVLGAAFDDDAIAWWQNVDGTGTNWIRRTVDPDFNGTKSVFATDVDRDGDVDVLGAALFADDVTWWENMDGAGTNWLAHSVDAEFDGAETVTAFDLDQDGDVDVLSAGSGENTLAWWENFEGQGTNWIFHLIDSNFVGAAAAEAFDLDGDGDLDALGAASTANEMAWWNNGGGQFALATTGTAPGQILPGLTSEVFSITMLYRGKPAESDEELTSVRILMEESPGDSLTTEGASNLFQSLRLYRDTGSLQFEAGSDVLVVNQTNLDLSAGILTIPMTDGDSQVQLAPGGSNLFFVVVELTDTAGSQPPTQFLLTHLVQGSPGSVSAAEDRTFDIPLLLECASNVTSGIVLAGNLSDLVLSKSGFPQNVLADSNLTYSLVVTNLGPSDALSVVVTDTLPAGVSFNLAASSPECSEIGGVVTCTLGVLSNASGRVLSIAVFVGSSTTGVLTNQALAVVASLETNLANNLALATVTVQDTDGDGQPDFHDADDDDDEMPDSFENQFGLDSTNAADAGVDGDLDSFVNRDEYIADTVPTNGNSFLNVRAINFSVPATIVWSSSAVRVYRVEYNSNLFVDVRQNLQTNLPGSNSLISVNDTNAAPARNYRIGVSLP